MAPLAPPSPLQLREGTQLLGPYEGSAYEQPTYLVRRDDGQVIHLSHLLYQVAALLDGQRRFTEIAEALSTQLGRQVVADNVQYLVEKRLRPTGLIASHADADRAKQLTRSLPLLALRYRKRVIPARMHRGASTALQPLFWPPLVLLVLAGLVATNIWLFGPQRTALTRAARQLPFHPNLFLLVTVLVIFSGFFHELGHATATRYGGGSPGVMGVGIYLAWPAFYTDLTDSYRLNRAGRLRSDLGGVYFNAVLIVAAGIAYLLTGFDPLAVFIVVSQAMAMYQFLPFVRLDGYYIMSDLVGVPNLFAYLGPVLRSMFHRSDPATSARLQLLKRRARLAIKVWSVITALFLAFNFVGIALLAPIILPAEWVSLHLQGQAMVSAFASGNVVVGVNELVDLVILAIAPVGLVFISGLLLRRAFQALKKWWPSHPKVTAALALVLAGVVLVQGQGLVARLEASPGSPGSTAMAVTGSRPGPAGSQTPGSAGVRPTPWSSADPLLFRHSAPIPVSPDRVISSESAPVRIYVVQVDDTLWGIAADQLGNPERWPAIFNLNVEKPQPDGRTLVDPDLIYPGWRLELPGSSSAAALVPPPSPPVNETVDAVVARPSGPPRALTRVVTGGTGTAPTVPVPAVQVPVTPPGRLAIGPDPSATDGSSPGHGSARETIIRPAVTSVPPHRPTPLGGPTATQGVGGRIPGSAQSAHVATGPAGVVRPEPTAEPPPSHRPVSSPRSPPGHPQESETRPRAGGNRRAWLPPTAAGSGAPHPWRPSAHRSTLLAPPSSGWGT